MKDNPVISRIRDARHSISQRFDHDPKKLVAHYMELQEKYQGRLISGVDSVGKSGVVAESKEEYGAEHHEE